LNCGQDFDLLVSKGPRVALQHYILHLSMRHGGVIAFPILDGRIPGHPE
jgi:hypothetical protein